MAKMTKILGALALSTSLMAAPVLAQTPPTADTVVAQVNGTDITLGEMIALRASLPDQYKTLPDDVLYNGLLDQLVQQTLLGQEVAGKLTRSQQLQIDNDRRSALAAFALDDIISTSVTNDALQAAYDAQYKDFAPGTEYHAAHILVDSEEKANDIKKQIEGGVDFADAAKTHGTDGTSASGGDLGWFGAGMMVKPFEDAVVSMKPGELKGPVQTDFGWHLIKLIETRPTTAPTLDEVRDQIAAEVEQKAVTEHLEKLTASAKIEKPGADLDPAVLKDDSLISK